MVTAKKIPPSIDRSIFRDSKDKTEVTEPTGSKPAVFGAKWAKAALEMNVVDMFVQTYGLSEASRHELETSAEKYLKKRGWLKEDGNAYRKEGVDLLSQAGFEADCVANAYLKCLMARMHFSRNLPEAVSLELAMACLAAYDMGFRSASLRHYSKWARQVDPRELKRVRYSLLDRVHGQLIETKAGNLMKGKPGPHLELYRKYRSEFPRLKKDGLQGASFDNLVYAWRKDRRSSG